MPDIHLQSVNIRHFKAFKEFQLKLEGRHLLVYGANGSGKSSLYWALHAFLESANKTTDEVQKYFDPSDNKSLINIYTPAPENKTAKIQFTIKDNGAESAYEISLNEHQTKKLPIFVKASLASNFLTYRFLYDFSHSSFLDLWPLFEREILPFCVTTSGNTRAPQAIWNSIKSGKANSYCQRGLAGTYAYGSFQKNTKEFASILAEVIDSISNKAQEFYDENFAVDDSHKLDLKLGIKIPPSYNRPTKKF